MKVALLHGFVGGPAGGGGGVRQLLELGRGLGQLGHEVVVCAYQFEPGTVDPELEEMFEYRAVKRQKIDHPKSLVALQKAKWLEMKRLADLIPDDVDVINGHESPVYMAGAFAKRRLEVPFVWTRNDATLYEQMIMPDQSWSPRPGRLMQLAYRTSGRLDRMAIRSLDAICVLDERNQRMTKRAYGRDAQIMRSGAAPRFFDAPSRAEARRQLQIDADEFAVLGVGVLYAHRRHEDIVRALAQLQENGRPPRLRLIGSDHQSPETAEGLRAFIAESGIADRVEMINTAVSDEVLRAHFAAADAFVFANEHQTWGLAPLEAIAAGTPVVVSRGAGVHEVLEGRAGVQLVDARAPDQIADALERIRQDASAFEVSATREWTREEFSAETFARRMAELFERLGG